MRTKPAEALVGQTIAVRSLGSGRVHRAIVNQDDLAAWSHWGADCTLATLAQCACLCGVVLTRGPVIQIPEGDALDSWRRNKHVCTPCERIASLL